MLEDLRRLVDAGLGLLSPSRAVDLARSLQSQSPQDIARRAQELLDWSRKNRARLVELVGFEVKRQLDAMRGRERGASPDAEGARGIERVEIGGSMSAAGSTATRSAAKASTGKTARAKRSTAEAASRTESTRKASTKRSSRKGSPAKRSGTKARTSGRPASS